MDFVHLHKGGDFLQLIHTVQNGRIVFDHVGDGLRIVQTGLPVSLFGFHKLFLIFFHELLDSVKAFCGSFISLPPLICDLEIQKQPKKGDYQKQGDGPHIMADDSFKSLHEGLLFGENMLSSELVYIIYIL